MTDQDGQLTAGGEDRGADLGTGAPVATVLTHPTDFDVFLSHNSRDKPTVERLAERLKRDNLEPWLDKWCLTPGGNWQNELIDGIRTSRACAFFIGPHGEGAWAREELHVALDRAAKDRNFRLFLVLLPGVEEPFDALNLPPFLSTRTWVDLRKGIDDRRAFQTFVHAVKGIPLGPEVAIERRDDICPYRGLQTFDEEHAEYFFGRDPDVQRLLEKLKTSRFLAVLGSSGSGKSSLVKAGLIPALKKGALPGSDRWPVRIMTPGAHPLDALAAQLSRLDSNASVHRTLDDLHADPRTLHLTTAVALADQPPGERVVWVIDQTEEVFTLCQDQAERTQLLDNLLYAATVPDGRCVVILTMRADFYPKCAAHPDFSSRISSQQYLVSPMDRDGLRQCVEEPARRVGLEFEQGLVPTILEGVETQPGALPLLQHALLELWERRRGYMLTLEGHQESGGVQGSIAKRADTIYANMTADRQDIARRMLLRLTQPGEGTEDTRRRATMRELLTSDAEADQIETVVKELADARLLITSGQDNSGDAQVDIAHEALIRSWPRLRQWLDEDRAALRVHRRLTEVSIEWARMDREDGFLYRGARLVEALDWRIQHEASLNDLEREFLDQSVRARDRETAERERARLVRERLRRNLIVGLGTGLLVAVALAGVAAFQWRNAEEQRQLAFTRQIATQAEVVRNGALPNLLPHSVLLAVEAVQRVRSPEAEQTLRRAVALLGLPLGRLPHVDFVQAATFSSDGRLLATASRDRTARLWEAATGKELGRLVHDDAVLGTAFSPDNRLLLTGSADRTARLWNTTDGAEVGRLSHDSPVRAVAFAPDGRLLATAAIDRSVRLWDATTRQEVGRLAHGGDVLTLAFSQDGRSLVTTSEDGQARVWDVASQQEQGRHPHLRPHRPAPISPDGRQLVTTSGEFTAALWNVGTSAPVTTLFHEDDPVLDVAMSPDGRLAATATTYGVVRIWETASGRDVTRVAHANGVNAVVFSTDGRTVATASTDATVKIWDTTQGFEIARLPLESPVFQAAFSPSTRYITTLSLDGQARLWEIGSRQEIARLEHGGDVSAIAFSGDGRVFATASTDGIAHLWDPGTGQEQSSLTHEARQPEDREIVALALTADARQLATGTRAGIVRLWDTTSRQELARLTHDRAVTRVVLSPDGRLLASGGADRTVRVLDVVSRQELTKFELEDTVNGIAFSPDSRRLAAASRDGVRVFDIASRQEVTRLAHDDGPVMNLAYSPDGSLLATASWQRAARLWNVASGQEQNRFVHTNFLWTVSFSRDGRYFATASTDGSTRVWETATQRELPRRTHDNAFVFNAVFSPDSKYLATASRDRTARLWDTVTGEEVARLTHNRDVIRVAFSPDGTTVATGSADRTARLWKAGAQDLMAEACAHVSRNFTRDEWRQYFGDEAYHRTCSDLPVPQTATP